jgi:elongator complex protein 3
MRSIRNNFDSYLIMMNRLQQYICAGHLPEKVEVIVQGGTFPSYPKKYQEDYCTGFFQAMNDFSRLFFKKGELDLGKFKKWFNLPADITDPAREKWLIKKLLKLKKRKTTLEKEQAKNEKSQIKCVGLTIETNPQYGRLAHGNFLLRLGCTRIELGVQTLYDKVLWDTNRGHGLDDTIKSIATLRDLGYKLNFHIMLGLPGVSKRMDQAVFKRLFAEEEYEPDMLKIYPCMVMPGTELFKDWKKGKFDPMTTKEAAKIIAKAKLDIPEYCRIMRVQRDIPTHVTSAGVDRTNLRQYADKEAERLGIVCKCIRCREVGRSLKKLGKVHYTVREYKAAGGNEFFIQALAGEALLGYCRLRFPAKHLRSELKGDVALIRELHVMGEVVGLGDKGAKGMAQHRGIGKKLMSHAEEIAETYLKSKMVVISAIGTKGYYKKLGYKKDGVYMSKRL